MVDEPIDDQEQPEPEPWAWPAQLPPMQSTTMVESPFAAPTEDGLRRHQFYLVRCLIDCILRGEAPFAGHGFYTMFMDDTIPHLRAAGMDCGKLWSERADRVAFYVDHGISPGMMSMLEDLIVRGGRQAVTFRALDHDAEWMRKTISDLPDYIGKHLDNVRVM